MPRATAATRFEEAFESVTGRAAGEVAMAGRTDRQIALALLDGADHRLPDLLEGLTAALERREEEIRRDGRALPAWRRCSAARRRPTAWFSRS